MLSRLTTFLIGITLFGSTAYSQTVTPAFEGEIVYANVYKSKNPKLREKQLSVMLGSVHTYYVKRGDYKTVTNGMFAQWQLYINKDNKVYNKMASSDTVFFNNAAEHDDEVLSSKITKKVTTILGYSCDELVLTCVSGVHKYYYNSRLRVDSKLFVNHKYGNMYNYLSLINAVPLKMIIEDSEIIMESTATQVKPKKLDPKLFTLPPGTKTGPVVY